MVSGLTLLPIREMSFPTNAFYAQNGNIRLYNLSATAEDDKLIQPEKVISGHQGKDKFTGNACLTCPFIIMCYIDLVSSASFNPLYPVMATCSGQRKFSMDDDSDDEDSNELPVDNSVQLWSLPGSWTTYDSYPTDNPIE